MTAKKWLRLTECGGKARNGELKAVDGALAFYQADQISARLTALREALEQWKRSQGSGEEWKNSVWNQQQQEGKPVEMLDAWIARKERMLQDDKRGPIPALQAAAKSVYDAYQSWMPDAYRSALETTFVAPPDHVYCYKRYETKPEWEDHLRKGTATGHDITKGDTVEASTRTLTWGIEKVEDEFVRVSRNLKAYDAPGNRRIEFHDYNNHHTLVHEMLHWVCHEQFRLGSMKQEFGEDFEYVQEGFTEWLARNALNEWTTGGYWRIMGDVIDAVKAGHPSADDLKRAYFQGQDVKSIGQDMVQLIRQQKSARLLQLDRNEIDGCLANIKSGRTRKFRDPSTAGAEFVARMKRAFQEVPLDERKRLLGDTSPWLAAL